MSRIIIALTLLGGIGIALYFDNLLELFKYAISIPAIFGASVWLGFIWRRLTKWAVIIQVFLCLVIYAVIPNLFMQMDSIRNNPKYLLETKSKQVIVSTSALQSDVTAGRALKVGETTSKNHTIEPVGIFFESVAKINPDDPGSPKTGLGRFQAEIWIISWFGVDFTSWSKPQLTAARFFFDALFPFVILFMFSFLTRKEDKNQLERFYAKMYTPVQATPEEDEKALQTAYQNPGMYENRKLFKKSNWEMLKPGKIDFIGFFGSWGLVGIIVFLLWLVVTIGK